MTQKNETVFERFQRKQREARETFERKMKDANVQFQFETEQILLAKRDAPEIVYKCLDFKGLEIQHQKLSSSSFERDVFDIYLSAVKKAQEIVVIGFQTLDTSDFSG